MDNVNVFPNIVALSQAVADYIVRVAQAAIMDHGAFSIGLSGGSTPRPLFELLAAAPYAGRIDWPRVVVFWSDERCVPPDHADSNYRMARETLLDHVPILERNIYRMRGEDKPQHAADKYEAILRAYFGTDSSLPSFDLLLLGMGEDGHTASLFPHTAALHERERWVVANYVEKLNSWRITLTVGAINAADHIVFMVSGQQKAQPVREVLHGEYHPDTCPAQLIKPIEGNLLWMLDAAAAALL